jgi:ectoine hydroxylase-related dioxygenase (phytanoyl-CoA dioxygenase family)
MGLKNNFRENGFVILDIADKSIVQELHAVIDKMLRKKIESLGIQFKQSFHDGAIALDKIDHVHIKNIYDTLRNTTSLSRLSASAELCLAVKELLELGFDHPLYCLYQVVRIDPPNDETFILGWHQETFSTQEGVPSIQVWGPLVGRNDRSNGSIDVLVGSHKEGEIKHTLSKSNDYLSMIVNDVDQYLTKYQKLSIALEPGQLLLFHPMLLHRSNHNSSDRVRYSFTAHFMDCSHDLFENIGYDDLNYENRSRCDNPHNLEF